MDALYRVVITSFGVGYGKVRPVVTVELRSHDELEREVYDRGARVS